MVPSDRISQNVGSKKSKSNYFREKYYQNQNKIPPHCLPFQFRPMIYACRKKKENINDRAIFVIVVVERRASLYRIFDLQSVPASEISKPRPIWTWISINEM